MKRGTSDVPLIMGIIGTVLNIPATLCSASCGALISGISTATGSESGSDLGNFIIFSAFVSGFSGLAGGIYSKSNPIVGGTLLSLATVLSVIQSFAFGNIFSFMVFILFLVGAIFAFLKTETNTNSNFNIPKSNVVPKNEPIKKSLKINIANKTKNDNSRKVGNPYK
jgi:hypothetical protein